MQKLTPDNTIKEAKALLREKFEEGVDCPCCGQYVKKWDKPLIGTAVADLIRLFKLYEIEQQSIHISSFTEQRSNFYTLTYWGLIEKGEVEVDEKKRSSGYWQPTPKGIAFVEGRIAIPAKAETYDNKVIAFSGDKVFVGQALGKKFDYAELMGYSLL